MEEIVEYQINKICENNNWQYLTEVTKSKLDKEWGMDLIIKESNKRLDFAVKTTTQIFLIETNFYNASGSKLKATANEYRKVWNSYGHSFIWITDGPGWHSDNSLKEAFDDIDHVINLHMAQNGVLKAILDSA
ncbi:MAG: DpnII family type II restriction endonuclease [Parvibaculales bacterium]